MYVRIVQRIHWYFIDYMYGCENRALCSILVTCITVQPLQMGHFLIYDTHCVQCTYISDKFCCLCMHAWHSHTYYLRDCWIHKIWCLQQLKFWTSPRARPYEPCMLQIVYRVNVLHNISRRSRCHQHLCLRCLTLRTNPYLSTVGRSWTYMVI